MSPDRLAPSSPPAVAELQLPLAGGALAARVYGRKARGQVLPLVLHFHGGAFTAGDLDSGECLSQLLAESGSVVVSLAYPLAPAAPFPAAVEAGYAALEWVYKNRAKLAGTQAPVYVAGEEAGGNLAASVALIARDRGHPPLAGQILVTPMLDPCSGTASLREAVGSDTCCKWVEGWRSYFRSPMDAEHPYAVPAHAQRLAQLPPALILAGEDDPMRDEAMAYAGRLEAAGIPVRTALLPATGWPGSLEEAAGPCACEFVVRGHFAAFFKQPLPPPETASPS